MTERVELKEENFYLHPSDTYGKLRITIFGNTQKNNILKQILTDQPKAKSWDDFYDHFKYFPLELMQWDEGNPDWEKFFKQCVLNIEDNKQLKGQVDYDRTYLKDLKVRHDDLKQKLSMVETKIDSHIYACGEILKDGQNETAEQKAIGEKYTQMLKYFTEIKTIIEDKTQ